MNARSIGQPGEPGYLDLGYWWRELLPGHSCARGFVGNSRFASNSSEQVIPRTNRNTTRKWRTAGDPTKGAK